MDPITSQIIRTVGGEGSVLYQVTLNYNLSPTGGRWHYAADGRYKFACPYNFTSTNWGSYWLEMDPSDGSVLFENNTFYNSTTYPRGGGANVYRGNQNKGVWIDDDTYSYAGNQNTYYTIYRGDSGSAGMLAREAGSYASYVEYCQQVVVGSSHIASGGNSAGGASTYYPTLRSTNFVTAGANQPVRYVNFSTSSSVNRVCDLEFDLSNNTIWAATQRYISGSNYYTYIWAGYVDPTTKTIGAGFNKCQMAGYASYANWVLRDSATGNVYGSFANTGAPSSTIIMGLSTPTGYFNESPTKLWEKGLALSTYNCGKSPSHARYAYNGSIYFAAGQLVHNKLVRMDASTGDVTGTWELTGSYASSYYISNIERTPDDKWALDICEDGQGPTTCLMILSDDDFENGVTFDSAPVGFEPTTLATAATTTYVSFTNDTANTTAFSSSNTTALSTGGTSTTVTASTSVYE